MGGCMGGCVDGHFDILLKPPQPFTYVCMHIHVTPKTTC